NVDQVAERLEGPERYAEWQQQGRLEQLHVQRRQICRQIFKEPKQQKIAGNANPQSSEIRTTPHEFGCHVIHQRTENQNGDEPRSPEEIKRVAGKQQKRLPCALRSQVELECPQDQRAEAASDELKQKGIHAMVRRTPRAFRTSIRGFHRARTRRT